MCGARDTRRPGGFARSPHWASIDIREPPNSPGLGKTGRRAAGPREKSSIRARSARGPAGGLLSSLVQDHSVLKPGNNGSCNPCSLLRVRRRFVRRHSVAVLFHLRQSAPRKFTATRSPVCRGRWRQEARPEPEEAKARGFAKLRSQVCESAPSKWGVNHKASNFSDYLLLVLVFITTSGGCQGILK